VLYVLDGEGHFQSAVAIVDFLTKLAMIPEMIVVAVPSTDRMRDLTPTHSTKVHGKVDPRLANSGGGEAFERFLETELIPEIESTYATMPYRVLVGHSLGGLLSVHAALQASAPFQAVIAMDPSLWWDDQIVVKQRGTLLSNPDARPKSIYMSTGALPLDNGEDASEGRAANQAFASLLSRSASATFRTKAQVFEQDNHQSVAFRSLYDGLLFTFEGYKLSTSAALEDTSRIDTHFEELSARFGVEWRPPQRVIDLVSFSLLFEKNKVDEAIRLLLQNTKVYPNSSAAHDHLGRAYLVKGDKASALRCFERALELDPSDEDLRAELVKLKKE
jgi:predicted alpha/beta superfamily hydrolase